MHINRSGGLSSVFEGRDDDELMLTRISLDHDIIKEGHHWGTTMTRDASINN